MSAEWLEGGVIGGQSNSHNNKEREFPYPLSNVKFPKFSLFSSLSNILNPLAREMQNVVLKQIHI